MLVKCRVCGAKIERDIAYKVTKGKINEYYCNEDEYLTKLYNRELKENTYNKIFEIFGYTVSNTSFYNEMKKLLELYEMQEIYNVLCENTDQLTMIMSNKHFETTYGKIRYFFKVLSNKIDETKLIGYTPKQVEVDIPDIKFKSRQRKTSLEDIELEVGDDY